MTSTSVNPVNPDLLKERSKCTFEQAEFTRWWYGGEKKLQEKRLREKIYGEDPELKDEIPTQYLSHAELYEATVKKATHLFNKVRTLERSKGNTGPINFMSHLDSLVSAALFPEANPLSLHLGMFIPAIIGHGTKEQQEKWMARAANYNIIGTYAQTELGHGTFLRGLETTATYDEKTQEFVLNSPTLTAYKWWPGSLGHTANYGVIIAKLKIKGKDYGVHPFMVQLRDEETHMPMPGIKIGEIGAKFGMNAVNNGFLGFEKVRISRDSMLMKHAQVLPDGTFVKPKNAALTYGTMVFVRVLIVRDMAIALAKAATISIRYSCVRRQSPINPNEPEVQVINHITQQHKLFPILAKSVVFKLASDNLWEMYHEVNAELDQGQLDRLPELHAVACCLKAVCSFDGVAGIETARLACGGHGYMKSSSFPQGYSLATAAITYEGENTVLFLQTARYLMKVWPQALKGDALAPTVAYLYKAVHNNSRHVYQSGIPGIIAAFQAIAARKIQSSYANVEKRKKAGYTPEEATNLTGIELVSAAEAHCRAFLIQSGYEMIEKVTRNLSPALTVVLKQLGELYAVDACIRASGDLLRYTTMTNEDLQKLQSRLEELLTLIRPNAVSIVDAFDIPDWVLNSALGSSDGNVYQRIFEEAQKSPLNKEPVNKSFHLYLKPFMRSNL